MSHCTTSKECASKHNKLLLPTLRLISSKGVKRFNTVHLQFFFYNAGTFIYGLDPTCIVIFIGNSSPTTLGAKKSAACSFVMTKPRYLRIIIISNPQCSFIEIYVPTIGMKRLLFVIYLPSFFFPGKFNNSVEQIFLAVSVSNSLKQIFGMY